MKIFVVAVGNRMPQWIADGFAGYAGRMPRTARMSLVEVKPESRTSGKTVEQMLAAEAARIEAALPAGCERIVMDEHGRGFTSIDLSRWLSGRLQDARDLAFIIGGPDGLAPEVKGGASLAMRLSEMTLPHGLARVLLAEQLYRATTIMQNHPYHRE
jgi:23S rRNA (pseudouridine1915-N3)-methyltransferase